MQSLPNCVATFDLAAQERGPYDVKFNAVPPDVHYTRNSSLLVARSQPETLMLPILDGQTESDDSR